MPPSPRRRPTDILFDLRTIIGMLFAVYGVVCLVMGLASFTASDSRRAAGVNLNLWAGIGMLVLAALFIGWCVWRPVTQDQPVPDPEEAADSSGSGATADAGATGGEGTGPEPRGR